MFHRRSRNSWYILQTIVIIVAVVIEVASVLIIVFFTIRDRCQACSEVR